MLAAATMLATVLWLTWSPAPLPPVTDFAAYWTAGRQLLRGANPYSAGEVLDMERKLGWTGTVPLIMRNPPWAIPLLLPVSVLPYRAGQVFWFSLSLAFLLLSLNGLRRLYRYEGGSWLPVFLMLAFIPVPVVLAVGQIAPILLLGVVGFLHFERKQWDAWAGFSAVLMAVKPHLLFLIWPALVFCVARQKRWRVLAGLGAGLALASGLCMAMNAVVFLQYARFWQEADLSGQLLPTVSGALTMAFGRQRHWLVLLPVAAALVWFGFHWRRNRVNWNWLSEMPLLLLVSGAATPYGWLFDQIILLPAVVQVAAWSKRHPAATRLKLAAVYLSINLLMLALIVGRRTFFWYAWTAPMWLCVYLAARGWLRPQIHD